jgi:hypothetical protein
MDARRDNERLHRLGARQAGRITRAQLTALGVGRGQLANWVQRGWLIPRLPKVYALGHTAPSQAARLWEAVLYAGPEAMLSHLTAAQWCGYLKYAPRAVHVSTPRKIDSLPGVVVHGRRHLVRATHMGIPVTTTAQTLLDLAATRPDLLERALGQVEFLEHDDLGRLRAATESHNPGCAALRQAVVAYDPNFARLNDEFEIDFYEKCREWGIAPLPLANVEIAPGLHVDGLWPDHHLGVELDGNQNHHTRAQLLRDAERDLLYREHGLTIIRYRRAQIRRSPERIKADLERQLAQRAPHAGS